MEEKKKKVSVPVCITLFVIFFFAGAFVGTYYQSVKSRKASICRSSIFDCECDKGTCKCKYSISDDYDNPNNFETIECPDHNYDKHRGESYEK